MSYSLRKYTCISNFWGEENSQLLFKDLQSIIDKENNIRLTFKCIIGRDDLEIMVNGKERKENDD